MDDLALQVGEVDLVVVAQGDAADAAGCQVERDGRAQPAGADHQRVRREQFLLAVDADLRQQDVPAVAQQLLVVQVDAWDQVAPIACLDACRSHLVLSR